MAHINLNTIPIEIVQDIMRRLDTETLLRSREVHSRIKAAVDSLPEYKTYQDKKDRSIYLYKSTRGKEYPGCHLLATRLMGLTRQNSPTDDHYLLQLLEYYRWFSRRETFSDSSLRAFAVMLS